jgi:pimeloyl-ACP methyl ester carboxylesterase
MNASLSLAVAVPAAQPRPQFLRIDGQPDREYYAVLPTQLLPGAEPLVLVHGISRNAAELVVRFAALAEHCGVPLIAPLFRRDAYGQYQQVIDPRSGLGSDAALHDILEDATDRFGLDTGRIALFGFSGGAQFSHRYALIHPGRVRACVPASAGWYTLPDPELAWPLGLKGLPGGPLDPCARAVPFHLIVGQRDHCDDDALRHSARLDALQGTNRRARARNWHRALRRAGWSEQSSLTVLPRTRHNFSSAHRNGLIETVFRLLDYKGTDQ